MEPQSAFMFLSICQEALGLSPQEALDSDYVLITSILREHNYVVNQRNKEMAGEDSNKEYIEITDFETGKPKRIEVAKSI